MRFQKPLAFFHLIRPELPAAAGICVVLGQAVALGRFAPLGRVASAFLLGFLLSASAMIFNDYFDLAVDRVNAPQRPLPSGRISPREAIIFGIVTAVIALWIAFAIDRLVFGLSLSAWVLGFLYNAKLKSAGLWGNLIVSLNVALTILVGGASVGQVRSPLVLCFAAIAAVFDLAEEIAGDAMDMSGDQERASQSIAIVHGRQAALRISAGLFGIFILLTLLPVVLGENGPEYLLPIFLMDALVVFFTTRLVKSQSREEGHRWMRRLYLSATLGLLAFILARFVS